MDEHQETSFSGDFTIQEKLASKPYEREMTLPKRN